MQKLKLGCAMPLTNVCLKNSKSWLSMTLHFLPIFFSSSLVESMADSIWEGRERGQERQNGWLEKVDADSCADDKAEARKKQQTPHAPTPTVPHESLICQLPL